MKDATERLDALQASFPRSEVAGRLTFHEKCAAYLLLQRGFKHSLVAKTLGVTQTTISHLAKAGRGLRYAEIAREFERLGKDAFETRYWSDDIETRLSRWRAHAETPADQTQRKFGPNPNADSAAGRYRIHAYDGTETTFHVYWVTSEGWSYRQDEEPGAFQSAKRLLSSPLARTAALENYGVDAENILEFVHEP